jgi:hypothetical protein
MPRVRNVPRGTPRLDRESGALVHAAIGDRAPLLPCGPRELPLSAAHDVQIRLMHQWYTLSARAMEASWYELALTRLFPRLSPAKCNAPDKTSIFSFYHSLENGALVSSDTQMHAIRRHPVIPTTVRGFGSLSLHY